MLAMRARPAKAPRSGPFVLPARLLFGVFGLLAVGLGTFDLLHKLHAKEVDLLYTVVGLVVAVVWVLSIALGYRGLRLGVFIAGAIAFVEFGVVASSHFVSGASAISSFVKQEGLPVATTAMALLPACLLTVMSAAVAWTAPRGRNRRIDTLPLLVVAVAGAVMVILAATDAVHRDSFGKSNTEDGAFAAAFAATLWLAGGLCMARVRRTGAIMVSLATFIVWYSFLTLHLVKGGVPLSEIASKSGVLWALIAAGAAVLALASLLMALTLLALRIWPSRLAAQAGERRPVRGEA